MIPLHRRNGSGAAIDKIQSTNPASVLGTNQLAILAPTIEMGGGPDVKPEHLLIIIPFNEPTTIIERIKKNHPNIKITFRQLQFADTPWKAATAIPSGQLQHYILPRLEPIADD